MLDQDEVFERIKALLARNYAWDEDIGMYRINFADAYDSEGYWLVGIINVNELEYYYRAQHPEAKILINVCGYTSVDGYPDTLSEFSTSKYEQSEMQKIYRRTMEEDRFGIFKDMADDYFWNEQSEAWNLSLNYYFNPEGHSDADIIAKIGECMTEGTNRIIEGRDNIIGTINTLADKDFREHLDEVSQDPSNIL